MEFSTATIAQIHGFSSKLPGLRKYKEKVNLIDQGS